jgi:sugar O-acyltransferase (sialic acid O-acetyltransferase NeuD family)
VLGKQNKDIILIGGGGHCKSVIDVISSTKEFKIAGIVDIKEKVGTKILGFPVVGSDDDLYKIVKSYKYFHISIGHILSNSSRIRVFKLIEELGGSFPVIKAYDAHVSSFSNIKQGTFIGHKVVVNAGVDIGMNCIINTSAIIEHDSIIRDHCHISTMATVNADCEIGESSFLSSHVVINRGIHIARQSRIFSGSVVTKSFEKQGVALKGMPAQIIQ